jgi:hypothetical protein
MNVTESADEKFDVDPGTASRYQNWNVQVDPATTAVEPVGVGIWVTSILDQAWPSKFAVWSVVIIRPIGWPRHKFPSEPPGFSVTNGAAGDAR